jgi:hypothetical protein
MLIRKNKTDRNIYGSLSLLDEDLLTMNDLIQYDNRLVVPSTTGIQAWPAALSGNTADASQKHGNDRAFAYDGMNLLLNALEKPDSRSGRDTESP